jgi:hypothetical protein
VTGESSNQPVLGRVAVPNGFRAQGALQRGTGVERDLGARRYAKLSAQFAVHSRVCKRTVVDWCCSGAVMQLLEPMGVAGAKRRRIASQSDIFLRGPVAVASELHFSTQRISYAVLSRRPGHRAVNSFLAR